VQGVRTRPWVLVGLWILLLALGCARDVRSGSILPAEEALRREVETWLQTEPWVRADGYGYAVDLGQLLIYAARGGERPLYLRLRNVLKRDYLIEQPCDVTTRGMVAWRWRPGQPAEASGTTEALRVAQGLWEGGRAFSEAADLQLALRILRGYLRHQCSQDGVWFVRNYFNLGTRTYATNSFLIDHDADLLQEVGTALRDRELLDAAQRTYGLVRQAVTPAGLLYEVVQPEVATLMDARLSVYSPNDEVRLANAATVAERSLRGAPEVGRRLLQFVRSRPGALRSYYLGKSGEGTGGAADLVAYAALLRLATGLADAPAAELFRAELVARMHFFTRFTKERRFYTASEVLLALQSTRSDLPALPPPPLTLAEEAPPGESVLAEPGLSPLAQALYRLFLELRPPQARDGQRCSDPAVADLAALLAETLAAPTAAAGWSRDPAQRQLVQRKIERFLRAVKVERERLEPIGQQILARLTELDAS
jgi:hypothetical protein